MNLIQPEEDLSSIEGIPTSAQIELVRESMDRCGFGHSFFDDFYAALAEASPGVGAMFAGVDMKKQNALAAEGIRQLVSYAEGSSDAEVALQKLGRRHGRGHLNISPTLYLAWTDALITTLQTADSECDARIEDAWRAVLTPGVTLMTSLYWTN